MALEHLKTPQLLSQNKWATRRIYEAIRAQGFAMPCTIVTPMGPLAEVNFDVAGTPFTLPNIVVPIAGVSQYIRQPFRAGDGGVVFPSSTAIGAVTGQGSGTPSLTAPVGNLSALMFFPVGNKNWFETDPAALTLYSTEECQVQITPAGVTVAGDTGNLTVEGNLSAGNGITCTFTTPTGQVVTVQDGIVTNLA